MTTPRSPRQTLVERRRGSPLTTVLWVGTVTLGKGIQYMLEAARLLRHEPIRFLVAGPIGISKAALDSAPPNVEFLGRVNRSQVHALYSQADLFVFPTLSDGFGITQLEAMSHGLPVIATPNCGEVVTDGVDGRVVPAADAGSLAAAIASLRADDELLSMMRASAIRTAARFSIAAYVETLSTLSGSFGDPVGEPGGRKWVVAQLGAREHYAVARGLHRAGLLRVLYTEAWCRFGAAIVGRLPGAVGAFGGRYHPDLEDADVRSFTAGTLARNAAARMRQRLTTTTSIYSRFVEVGGLFSKQVARDLRGLALSPERDAFFGYSAGSLEVFRALKSRGIPCVIDQVDAARVHEEVVLRESELWPGWQAAPGPVPEVFWDRLSMEWALADLVVVNSRWTQDALIRQGVARSKIKMIPLALEA